MMNAMNTTDIGKALGTDYFLVRSELTEQETDFGGCLEIARSLRERIDWDDVRERTAGAPFAAAFFTLVEELGVLQRR